MRIMSMNQRENTQKGVMGQLLSMNNLTFFKDYQTRQGSLDADYSVGSPTATFTANRSASTPATFVDASGVIQVTTTSNIPRYQGGYYDETGFHAQRGLMVEGAGTNLVPKSYTMNDATWTATNVTVADGATTDPAGGSNAASLTASAGNGTVILATAVTAQTYSVWLKRKTGTGDVMITANGGTGYSSALSLSSTDWRRFQISVASASQTCGIKIVTSTDAIYVYGNQFEASPYATSFIPTTTAALTRNAEVLKYIILGNRTAASETIAIKFAANSTFDSSAGARALIDTDTKERTIYRASTALVLRAAPNFTDFAAVLATGNTTILGNTSYVVAGVFADATNDSINYLNGSSDGVSATNTWDGTIGWGTNFEIGTFNNGGNSINGVIQSIAIFSTALDATGVSSVTNAMNQ